MKKISKLLSILLAAALGMSLAACGGESTSTPAAASQSLGEVTSPQSTAPEHSEAPEGSEAPASELEASEPQEPAVVIDYPLDGSPSFSVLYSKPTLLDSTIMSSSDFDSSLAWDAMVEATGVTLEWQSVSEQAWETQISLILAAGDYPDACNSNHRLHHRENRFGRRRSDAGSLRLHPRQYAQL